MRNTHKNETHDTDSFNNAITDLKYIYIYQALEASCNFCDILWSIGVRLIKGLSVI